MKNSASFDNNNGELGSPNQKKKHYHVHVERGNSYNNKHNKHKQINKNSDIDSSEIDPKIRLQAKTHKQFKDRLNNEYVNAENNTGISQSQFEGIMKELEQILGDISQPEEELINKFRAYIKNIKRNLSTKDEVI